jgi:HPt (histidine-containing phosphotransfer) domain-containing protein
VGADGQPPRGAADGPAPVLDAAALAGLRELDPTGKNHLIERVLAAFRTSTARLIPQLLEAHRTADLKGVRHVAHTLKSSSASVGGMKLSGICADLESRIRLEQGGDLTPQVQALVEETDKLLLALERLTEDGQ